MMVGRREMMFLAREHFRHGFSNAVMWWPASDTLKQREIRTTLSS
jgi:hypothetical protein